MKRPWDRPLKLHELGREPVTFELEPDAGQRLAIARRLGLESLPALEATVKVRPWLDGVELSGRFRGAVEQVCGVSLDAFEQPVAGEIHVQAVPAGSPNAPQAGAEAEDVELDLDAPDPPDVLEKDEVDLAAYVEEHLALEIDPFPRKPGVEFDYTPPPDETSPFAALKKLQDKT